MTYCPADQHHQRGTCGRSGEAFGIACLPDFALCSVNYNFADLLVLAEVPQ